MVQEKLVSSEKTKKEEGVHQDEPELRFPEFNDSWKSIKIHEITDSITKGTTPKNYSEEGINFIKVENIENNQIININSWIDENTHYNELNRSILEKNDLLFSIAGTLGRTAKVTEDILPANTNQALAILKISDFNTINVDYVQTRLNCSDIEKYIFQNLAVGAQPNLNLKQVGNIEIKLPSKSEQDKIQNFINFINKKIELLEKTQEKLEKLNFDLINKIMEQNYKIPNRTYDWRRISLYKIGNSFTGLSGKNKEDFSNGNSNFIPYSSIFNDIILDPSKFEQVDINESENQNLVEKGDIFFTGSSETPDDVGMASVLLDDLKNCYLNSFCFGFRLKSSEEYNPLFLVYYFRSLKFKKELFKLAQGSTRFNISKKELLKKEIEVPSKEDQDYYVNLINNMFAKTKHINTELCYMKNFKKGLLQKMFV